jgi:AraC-like DNA-binding protein
MVCVRCETIVKTELEKIGLPFHSIKSGEVEIVDHISEAEKSVLHTSLDKLGLELLDDKKNILVEKIINLIVDLVHYNDIRLKVNLSDYLKEKLHYDYAYLSRLFAVVKGTTIEHFFISYRIERAKEMLKYEDLTLIEIAEKLHFSDASHFCNQFKKSTGLTPSYFRKLRNNRTLS